ncbi:conjugal transfer protein TrbD [Acidithiobacillus ferridurans]|uniref:conjugal transfer protein TrbD n=1 Tax=Acidithiobacillus ferridurans TaxID=1232575 RepID=UPI001C0728E0|nr:conjugal transfer protein TrbD [Acidithiobacillus ferridurans]MBU2733479.1 conjugal transfer protein TrbD [Acidithiobacillus ferridurans]
MARIYTTQQRMLPFHRSLLLPTLLAGGERELVILNAMVAFGIMSLATGTALATGAVMGIVGQTIVVLMAKNDPQMRAVYQRARFYLDYYRAQSSPWAAPSKQAGYSYFYAVAEKLENLIRR